jgi:anti-anti-sigma regulatory factor
MRRETAVRIEENTDRTVLVVAGPIRLGDVPGWLEMAQRAAATARPVDIDLSAAEHMHAAAWQVLCALSRAVRSNGLSCRIRSMSPAAANACTLIGLDTELSAEAA